MREKELQFGKTNMLIGNDDAKGIGEEAALSVMSLSTLTRFVCVYACIYVCV